jgi:flagellar motor switch protein FliN/FliY
MASDQLPQDSMDFNWDGDLQGGGDSATPLSPLTGAGPSKAGTPKGEAGSKDGPSLDLILDIPLEISVELGRAKMIINDLLQLGQGSVIELNKLAGEPLEILINQKLIARGEVVVVNEKFGIRLTDIISPMERIKQLGG